MMMVDETVSRKSISSFFSLVFVKGFIKTVFEEKSLMTIRIKFLSQRLAINYGDIK